MYYSFHKEREKKNSAERGLDTRSFNRVVHVGSLPRGDSRVYKPGVEIP
jgi:hypothetical protein